MASSLFCWILSKQIITLLLWTNFKSQVQQTVTSCFAMLRQLHSIRQSVLQPVYQTLIVSLVLTRLDYGDAMLVGWHLCRPTQPSPVGPERCGSVNRWLTSQSLWPVFTGFVNPSKSRSNSRLSSTEPCTAQLLDTCQINCIKLPTCRRGASWGQRLPTDLSFVHHSWSLLETAHLLLLVLESGTVSLKMSHLLHRCQCFNVNWRLTCFGTRTHLPYHLLR